MAERAINQRKAQFLESFAPVSVTLDELIREKLECGKFPLTKTAWIKVATMLMSVAGLAFFLGQRWDVCDDKPNWFLILFPTCMGSNIFIQLLFYIIFSCGTTIKAPGKWVKADICVNLLFGLFTIVGSIMTTVSNIQCLENPSLHHVPGYLGIVGGGLSVIGCAAIFLMYRYVDDENETESSQHSTLPRSVDPRKSVFA